MAYQWESEVKDSELDALGIVNNAVYMVYFEHCRHKHMSALGVSFIDLYRQGTGLVVAKCEINYKKPLVSGDVFIVSSQASMKGKTRIMIKQNIIKKSSGEEAACADVVVTGINLKTRKIQIPEILSEKISC